MKILFLAQRIRPHMGGVETHIGEVASEITQRGHTVRIVSAQEINYPHIKFLGLLYIWYWLLRNKRLIEKANIVHCHDVFIWYLPFRFLYPGKKVFTTFHGWEGIWPIPFKNILLKRLANRLSTGSITVGKYIEKYYGIKADKIIYGAQD